MERSFVLPGGNILIGLVWFVVPLGLWLALSQIGASPQNDDPFYGKPVQWAVESGRLQQVAQDGELTATSLGHVAVGVLFCELVGWSYSNLSLVCILQQVVGTVALFAALRELGTSLLPAFVVASAMLFNPWYFCHAYTFMTDGPETAWRCIALLGFVRGFLRHSAWWIVVGSLAVACGIWFRQTNGLALIIPLVAVAVLAFSGMDRRRRAFEVCLILVFPMISLGLLESGWICSSTASRIDDLYRPRPLGEWIWQRLIDVYGLSLLIGLLLLPVAPLLLQYLASWRRRVSATSVCYVAVATLVVVGLVSAPFIATSGRAAVTNSTGPFIQNAHLGPIFLSDMDDPQRWGVLAEVAWPWFVWQGVTVISLMSFGVAIFAAFSQGSDWIESARLARPTNQGTGLGVEKLALELGLAVMIVVSIACLLTIVHSIMDRYWLLIFPASLLLVASRFLSSEVAAGASLGPSSPFGSVAILVIYALFNGVMVHDLWAWNRARWNQVSEWIDKGLRPQDFDGGRDVNAWLRMDEDPHTSKRPGDSSKWWNGLANYCIATGPRTGWRPVRKLPFYSWAVLREQHLWVLEREDRLSFSGATP